MLMETVFLKLQEKAVGYVSVDYRQSAQNPENLIGKM